MRRALFLDRDGTLIVEKDYLSDPGLVELLPGVREFLSWAKEEGYFLFLYTNQSGIGRGYYTLKDAQACNERMIELLGLGEDIFTDVCIAPETPEMEGVYRKPSGRYISEMVEQYNLDEKRSWCIGDKVSDLQAGVNGGIRGAWVGTGKEETQELRAYIVKHNLLACENLKEVRERLSSVQFL